MIYTAYLYFIKTLEFASAASIDAEYVAHAAAPEAPAAAPATFPPAAPATFPPAAPATFLPDVPATYAEAPEIVAAMIDKNLIVLARMQKFNSFAK